MLFGCLCSFENIPLGMFLVCVVKGCLSVRTVTQECFRLKSGWPPPDQYCSQAFSVLLSWINTHTERERVIHFSGKTGYSKTLQVTTKQTCSHTIIFIKEPHSIRGRRPHGGALHGFPSPALSPPPTCWFLWSTVSSDGKSGSKTTERAH